MRDRRSRARVVERLGRLRRGLRGDWRSVGGGVCELRIDTGPGWRVYFGQDEPSRIILLCGGDKKSRTKDIEKAHAYWNDNKARSR